MKAKQSQQSLLLLTLLATIVVGLGAYTRLSDSGLGCPDWPGCYGRLIVDAKTTPEIQNSSANFKAWTEMIHRYIAGILAIGIVAYTLTTLRLQTSFDTHAKRLHLIVCLIVVQAAFGAWTVTWKLHPMAVMPHLIGGMSITTLLYSTYLLNQPHTPQALPNRVLFNLYLCVLTIGIQIVLGGWTSANYAQLICPDFPTCQGQWVPSLNFTSAFHIPPIGPNYEGGLMSTIARTTIHYSHRIGALFSSLCFISLAVHCFIIRRSLTRNFTKQLTICLVLFSCQILLGIANIVLALPLTIAVMHNVGALLLLLACIQLINMSTTDNA